MTELHIEVRVTGPVADSVLVELGDLRVVSERVETVLRGPVPDQAALVGMINRLQIWGVELKSFRQLVPDVFTPDAGVPSGDAPRAVTPPDGRPASRKGLPGAADPRHA
ncbi:hypothetical protein ACVBEQ_13520 [Nakamurella sp. GG22]